MTDKLFAHVLHGDPVELDEFEKEISKPILMITGHELQTDIEDIEDIEDILVNAIMRRSCNPIRIHLRLTKGFNPDAVLTQSEIYAVSGLNCRLKARELARFYTRIANLRNRILQEQAQQQSQEPLQTRYPEVAMTGKLQHAYAIQMENMRNKRRENQEHLDRIMRTILLNPDQEYRCIHPMLTNADLDALELQVQDILECGCATHELCCIKLTEAAIESQICDALIAELNALNTTICDPLFF